MAPLQFGDDDGGMDCESSKRGYKRSRDDGEPREEVPDDETEDEEEEAMGTLVIKEEEEDDGEEHLDIRSQPRKKARTERSLGDSLSAQRK
jgi:hypothetical protein